MDSREQQRHLEWKVLAVIYGAIAGFVILCGAAVIQRGWPGGFWAVVRLAIERLSILSVVGLTAAGFAFGFLWERPYSKISSFSLLAAFPVLAFGEMLSDPTSHNLWPFEFVFYAILTLFGWLGLKISDWTKRPN